MRLRPVLVSAVALGLVAVFPAVGHAGEPAGSVGHDVSYPQCSASGSSTTTVSSLGGAFGIVGVTGGRPFGPNSCAAAEYTWAQSRPNPPALYMNTANPAPTSSYYWPTSGSSDPALCINAASTTDPGCAYDYGWHAAANALTTQAAALSNAGSVDWWLDVETANSWNGNGTSNAADLQGAIDYLRSHNVPSVGIYSTGSQWTTITGGYDTANAASYASAWSSEFTARYPMTSAPLWIAGLGTQSTATTNCGTSFTGGPTQLAQFNDGSGYDADLACGTAAPSPPQSLTAAAGDARVTLNWSAPASTGGAAVSYSVYRGTSSGSEALIAGATGLTSRSYTDTGLTNGQTYYYEVTATNSAGGSGYSNEASATPAAVPQSFTLSLNPTSGTAKGGGSVTSTVSVTETGALQTVTLTASTPTGSGITASVSPSSVSTATGTATLTVNVARTVPAGSYAITVTANGASGTARAVYTLKVTRTK